MDVTQSDDQDLRESMGRFQAALTAQEPEIVEPKFDRVLLALDGSNQDDTATALAATLARRDEAEIALIYAHEGPRDAAREEYFTDRVAGLERAGLRVNATGGGDDDAAPPYERILEARRSSAAGLIVVCAPYLEDFDELGHDSVGVNLDKLMSHSPVPILVARAPRDDARRSFDHLITPISPFTDEVVQAVAWAMRLADRSGLIRLVAVVDRETVDESRDLIRDFDDIDEGTLAGLRRPQVAGLIAAAQRRANERGLHCRVSVRSGEAVEEIARLANEENGLIASACPRKPTAAAYQRVQALVRASTNPVLVV
ncbi:MAG: universal stress protein [Phycisphaerales bacterium]